MNEKRQKTSLSLQLLDGTTLSGLGQLSRLTGIPETVLGQNVVSALLASTTHGQMRKGLSTTLLVASTGKSRIDFLHICVRVNSLVTSKSSLVSTSPTSMKPSTS